MIKKINVLLVMMIFNVGIVSADPECGTNTRCVETPNSCPAAGVCPQGIPKDCPKEGGTACTSKTIACDTGCGVKDVTIAQFRQCEPECIPDYGKDTNCTPSICPEGLPSNCENNYHGEYCIQSECQDTNGCGTPPIPVAIIGYCEPELIPTPAPTPTRAINGIKPVIIH